MKNNKNEITSFECRKAFDMVLFVYVYTTRPDKHGSVLLVPCKKYAIVRYCTVAFTGQVMFTRHQKHAAMYNWSPCMIK